MAHGKLLEVWIYSDILWIKQKSQVLFLNHGIIGMLEKKQRKKLRSRELPWKSIWRQRRLVTPEKIKRQQGFTEKGVVVYVKNLSFSS